MDREMKEEAERIKKENQVLLKKEREQMKSSSSTASSSAAEETIDENEFPSNSKLSVPGKNCSTSNEIPIQLAKETTDQLHGPGR